MQCPDCPSLDASRMPPGWSPRSACCLEARKVQERAWAEGEAAWQSANRHVARTVVGLDGIPMNRAARRRAARQK